MNDIAEALESERNCVLIQLNRENGVFLFNDKVGFLYQAFTTEKKVYVNVQ